MLDKEIWVVGDENLNADKSFQWIADIPDITDADVLIIDLSTFPADSAKRKGQIFQWHTSGGAPPPWVKDYVTNWQTSITNNIMAKLIGGGHIILLLDKNPVSEWMLINGLIPFGIRIIWEQKRTICYDSDHTFAQYLSYVKQANYLMQVPSPVYGQNVTVEAQLQDEHDIITDKSKRRVGASYFIASRLGYSGRITLLPSVPLDKRTKALDVIITVFRDVGSESPPPWVESVMVPETEELEKKVANLYYNKREIESEISRLEFKISKLYEWRKLLYSNGKQLEESVKAAFVELGFVDIQKGREIDKEDLIMKLNSVSQIGVMEIKGKKTRARISDMDQCIRWVDDYESDNPHDTPKGILVVNQLRLESYPESINERNRFESNQRLQAELRKICIIPTCVLFETIKIVLDGHKPDREEIERKISTTDGVLESFFD